MTFDAQKVRELEELRNRLDQLEAEMKEAGPIQPWPPQGFYSEYYATTGFLLGAFGAAMSLLVNVIGAPIAGKSPLELIRVYLTFPLGERALELASGTKDVYAIGDGVVLAVGCCLYLATGMILGVPFFVTLVRLTQFKSFGYRLVVATGLAVALWFINFWLILSWLQPLLFGGNWITNSQYLPSWVALSTHLVFGWTLAVLYPWGAFEAYKRPTSDPVSK
ncbi:hypothetical protein [Schlesneria paludicola]|uniref:hypothetical protein n=1 Tax=Schlesneria paludicola TaxID=360056 RepID=UPI00029A32F5|nr:hypothetical protein [Schlesneria paludicola]